MWKEREERAFACLLSLLWNCAAKNAVESTYIFTWMCNEGISMMHIYVYMHISCIFRSAVIVIFPILCPTTKNKKLAALTKFTHRNELQKVQRMGWVMMTELPLLNCVSRMETYDNSLQKVTECLFFQFSCFPSHVRCNKCYCFKGLLRIK